jgi:hypothetical protein
MYSINYFDELVLGQTAIWPFRLEGGAFSLNGGSFTNLTFEELDEPDPQQIGVTNHSNVPVPIPAGFLVGGLLQTRMTAEAIVVAAGETVGLMTFCVEEGRFSNATASRMGGRAPISFWAERSVFSRRGREFAANPGKRQHETWSRVREVEARLGESETHNLEQTVQRSRITLQDQLLRASLAFPENANAYVITLFEKPLAFEYFSAEGDAKLLGLETAVSTNISAGFGEMYGRVSQREIDIFLRQALASMENQNHALDDVESWFLSDEAGAVLQATSLNYQNRILAH